jgi:hypothetical protein
VENHIRKKHKEISQDIRDLGWFWKAIQIMIRNNARTTLVNVLGQGTIWKCQNQYCYGVFVSPMAVRNYVSKTETVGTLENWEHKMRCLKLIWALAIEETSDPRESGRMQSERGETFQKSQSEPRPISSPQPAAQVEHTRRRIADIAPRNELDNESNPRLNPSRMRAGR